MRSDFVYGFYNVADKVNYKKNSFTFEEWAELEASGVVFLPLAGARAGYYGNNWSGSAVSELSNPLASGYDWVDNVNWMGYYWLSTPKNAIQVATAILPGWHNYKWNAPAIWSRERRRGQSVRLVTRIPKVEWTEVRTGLTPGNFYTICLPKEVTAFRGASIWNLQNRDEAETEVYLEEAELPFAKGTPFIIQATADKLEVMYTGVATDVAGVNGALHGTLVNLSIAEFDALPGTIFILKDNAIRPRMDGYNYLSAYRAYINYDDLHPVSSAPQGAPGKRVIAMPMQKDAAQGFDNIEASDKPMKVVIDGTLYILRGEKVYDATGRLVK